MIQKKKSGENKETIGYSGILKRGAVLTLICLSLRCQHSNVKRKEFCYAGYWTAMLNLDTGILRQCYCGKYIQNVFKGIDKPIKWQAIGEHCTELHYHNSHVWLTLGDIPTLDTPTYSSMRNRVCKDGSEWLQLEMKEFLSGKSQENNWVFTEKEEKAVNRKMKVKGAVNTVVLGSFR